MNCCGNCAVRYTGEFTSPEDWKIEEIRCDNWFYTWAKPTKKEAYKELLKDIQEKIDSYRNLKKVIREEIKNET